jgi:hypothetical protein
MDVSLAGFNSANELAKQLITLATGILALSITFIRDILKNNAHVVIWPLTCAWVSYLLSVCFGIWTMMAITGTIFEATQNPTNSATYEMNISVPALLQILAFIIGTILLIVYGAKMLRVRTEPVVVPENTQK